MVNDTFSSNSDERVLYAEVHPMTGIDATKIDASFDAWVRGGAEEDRAVAYLAEQIEAFSVAHPDLQVFVVRGGWPNARSAGVTLVDTSSREAIWFFGRAVRMSAHRRSGSPVSP